MSTKAGPPGEPKSPCRQWAWPGAMGGERKGSGEEGG